MPKSIFGSLNQFHVLSSIVIVSFIFVLYIILPNSTKYIVLTAYILFTIIQLYVYTTGALNRPRANGFFVSIYAVDIHTHFFGAMSFYLIIFVYNNSLFNSFIIITLAGLFFEIFEWTFEKVLMTTSISQQQKNNLKFVSEPLENIAQDIIVNIFGALSGALIVLIYL